MLAPPRLLELIRDPRIIAAAVANATTALMNGLSAANQKLVFMLSISSVRRSTFQKISKNRHTADNADKTDESKPNRRMIKTKMIGVMLMAILSGSENR
jgi:hypothetical protein